MKEKYALKLQNEKEGDDKKKKGHFGRKLTKRNFWVDLNFERRYLLYHVHYNYIKLKEH